tara:strand:+ start:1960 stop:2136 length:177 start_codon:yes stop_codon:yes gene_type:complete
MFGLFKKNESSTLQKKYEDLMKKAVEAQRKGDIALFSELSAQAEEVGREIDNLNSSNN